MSVSSLIVLCMRAVIILLIAIAVSTFIPSKSEAEES